MKLLNICIAAIAISTLSHAGNEGGGGGGICTPQKCMTLAEAGLRFDKIGTEDFRLSVEQVKDLITVIDTLPLDFDRRTFRKNIMGRQKNYIVAQASDMEKFEKFKEEYKKILKGSGYGEDAGFELLAATVGDKTYILPGFEKLTTRGKSLILIHEGMIRHYKASVPQALELDGHILDATKVAQGEDKVTVNYLSLIEIFEKFKIAKATEQGKVSGNIIERRIIDANLEVQKIRVGKFTSQSYTQLVHTNCLLHIENTVSSPVENALLSKGYFLVRGGAPESGELSLTNFELNQSVNSNGCLDTHVAGFIQYKKGQSSIQVAGGVNRHACNEIWGVIDAEKTASYLFPVCKIK